jgi:hypothetical protein
LTIGPEGDDDDDERGRDKETSRQYKAVTTLAKSEARKGRNDQVEMPVGC